MNDSGFLKCKAKYCRQLAAAGEHYCAKHKDMKADEIIDEQRAVSTAIVLTPKQVKMLVDYALRKLME